MRALITGAGGGLGGACVAAFRAAGWTVVPTDMVAGGWSADDPQALVGTIGSPEWLDGVRRIAADGLDAVVAAHGVEGTGAFPTLTAERLGFVMDANFASVVRLFDAVAEPLAGSSGVFVTISSQAGLQGEPSSAAYCASKFGVRRWIDEVRRASDGSVRFRTLCPGATETPLLRKAFEGWAESEGVTYEDILHRRSSAVPVQRLGRPSDIGAAALWLAELQTDRHVIAPVTGGEVLR